jgi:hypothetical protein
MPRGRPQRGDFTGQETERLQREHADELVRRQQEIGLTNAVDVVIEEEGIFDPATGQLVEMSDEAQARVDALNDQVHEVDDPDAVLDPRVKPRRDPMQSFEDMAPKRKEKPTPSNPMEVADLGDEVIVTEEEYRTIRVNTDIEDMTYGVGNNLTFLRGRRYSVPMDIYRHLDSKGLIYH